jgi:diacylglycerol kinase family enzyme
VVRPPRVVATVGGREVEGVSVFVQNAQPYTYFRRRPINLSDGAGLGSGDLSGAVLTRANPIDVPTIAYRLLSKRARVGGHRRVVAFDGIDAVRVRSADDRPVPVQVDGDYVGEHEEAVFSVLPGGLKVLG